MQAAALGVVGCPWFSKVGEASAIEEDEDLIASIG